MCATEREYEWLQSTHLPLRPPLRFGRNQRLRVNLDTVSCAFCAQAYHTLILTTMSSWPFSLAQSNAVFPN